MKKIIFFVGTTAELIKIAPVMRELKKRKMDFSLYASNQNTLHFKELRPVIADQEADYTFKTRSFKWPKDIYLRFVIWSVKSFVNYFLFFREKFAMGGRRNFVFVVHGDTVTACIGAVLAKILRVKLIHIESGLRSYSFFEPFPEEINRFVISWLADVHFCPNHWSMGNLKFRGGKKVNTYGNTVGESLYLALKNKKTSGVSGIKSKKYFVLVLHRQEHTLFNKQETMSIINLMSSYAKNGMKCVFIMHRLTEDYLKKQGIYSKVKKFPNVLLPSRLSHSQFVALIDGCEFIATDGGSNQEEAYYLGKPCLILRNRTERTEGLGKNAVLARGNTEVIADFLKNYKKYKRKKPVTKKPPSGVIVDYIARM